MRLKSLRLRRAESANQEAEQRRHRTQPDSVEHAAAATVPSGRVRHDERGMAVWDWAVATGEFADVDRHARAARSSKSPISRSKTTRAAELTLEKAGRDKGGGFDPYNQRGSGKRQGEAAQRQGVTGAARRAAVLDQLSARRSSPAVRLAATPSGRVVLRAHESCEVYSASLLLGSLGCSVVLIFLVLVAINWNDRPPSAAARQFEQILAARPAVPGGRQCLRLSARASARPTDGDPVELGARRMAWLGNLRRQYRPG